MYADALRAYERMGSGDSPGPLAEIGLAHALSGNRREALRILRRLEKISTERYVRPDQLLRLYAALGDMDKAVTVLEKSISELGKCVAAPMQFDPRFDETRSEPRVAALIRDAEQEASAGR
jgi:tetratricopeptide (TPR) repeat protein